MTKPFFHTMTHHDKLFGLRKFDILPTFVIWHSGLTSRVRIEPALEYYFTTPGYAWPVLDVASGGGQGAALRSTRHVQIARQQPFSTDRSSRDPGGRRTLPVQATE
ncbi:MAG: hypothetical protein ACE5KM_17405 [Planctomycetaceae bacterium]